MRQPERTMNSLLRNGKSVFQRGSSVAFNWQQVLSSGSNGVEGGFALSFQQVRCASKKQGGSTQNGRESNPKHLGCKLYDNHRCQPGNIIVRQRGTRFFPGENTGMGTDHTIFSKVHGHVKFHTDMKTKRRTISVVKLEDAGKQT